MLKEIIRLEITSNPRLSPILRKIIRESAIMVGFQDSEVNMIILAVDEAFSNIIRHTYNMDKSKPVHVVIELHEHQALGIKLVDHGPPIKTEQIKGRALEDVKPGGLGVHFIHSIMDVVEYLPRSIGNCLNMLKMIKGTCPINVVKKDYQEQEHERLQALLEIGQSLHRILDLDKLLALVVTKVQELMEAEGAAVILLSKNNKELFFHTVLEQDSEMASKLKGMRFPATKGIAGRVVQTGKPVLVADVTQDPDHFGGVDQSTGSVTTSLAYAPLKIRKRIIGVLSAKNKQHGQFDQADLDWLTTISSTIALSIDNARSQERMKDTRRIRREFESARRMHKATLPQETPEIPGMDISALCIPATEVGGDYYDFFTVGSGSYAFAFGDVSGHGLESGMMVSMARSCLLTQINFSCHLPHVMDSMNRMVYAGVKKRLIMTFFFALYDIDSRVFEFSNAGHPPPFYYSHVQQRWLLIEDGEFPLGVAENHTFQTYSCELHPGDILVFYSDGIIEATNTDGDRYSLEKLQQLLQSQRWNCAGEIEDAILQELDSFCNGAYACDDRTLMVLYLM